MTGIGLRTKAKTLINECVGYDCKSHDGYNDAIEKIATEYKELKAKPVSAIVETSKKLKGKIVKSKGMAHQHQDIDEITEQVRQKLQEKPAEKPKDERKLIQHDALDTRSKKVYCPGCKGMVDNPNFKKPTHKCADESCGQLIPAAQGIEGTCPNCGADEFEELEADEE